MSTGTHMNSARYTVAPAARPRPIRSWFGASAAARGLSLIELMVAMLIGMVVIASASAIFISNRQTYRATESMGRVQESGRISFELMARDVREAGGNPCGKDLPMANVLNGAAATWWSNWGNGIVGYDGGQASAGLVFGTAAGQRIAGTDAIELKSGDNASGVTVVAHNPTAASFQLNTANHTLDDSDVVMVCDFRQATIMQVTNAQPGTNSNVVHNSGGAFTPGNCSKGLGFPTDCGSPNGNRYQYDSNSMIVRLHAARWYIGSDGNGGRSLFRAQLTNTGAGVVVTPQEIATGVRDMRLQYLTRDAANYRDASALGANEWRDVTAVRIALDLQGEDRIGTDGQGLQRALSHTVSLRNRMP